MFRILPRIHPSSCTAILAFFFSVSGSSAQSWLIKSMYAFMNTVALPPRSSASLAASIIACRCVGALCKMFRIILKKYAQSWNFSALSSPLAFSPSNSSSMCCINACFSLCSMPVNDALESTVQANSFWANPASCSSASVVSLSIVGFAPALIGAFTSAFTILPARHTRPSAFIVCLSSVEHLPAPITGPKLPVSFAPAFAISALASSAFVSANSSSTSASLSCSS